MNIVISVNDAYVNHAKVMLFSLCRHTQEDVCVYLLNRNLSRKQCAKFSLFLEKKCHASLYVLDMDEMFDDMPTVSSQFSVDSSCYRMICQERCGWTLILLFFGICLYFIINVLKIAIMWFVRMG